MKHGAYKGSCEVQTEEVVGFNIQWCTLFFYENKWCINSCETQDNSPYLRCMARSTTSTSGEAPLAPVVLVGEPYSDSELRQRDPNPDDRDGDGSD